MTTYQVSAGGDDGARYSGAYGFTAGTTTYRVGYQNDANYYNCDGFARFTGVTVAGTVTAAYLEAYAHINGAGAPTLKIRAADAQNPSAPTNASQFDAIQWTTAGVDWDEAWIIDTWEQSPSIVDVIQELVDTYTLENTAILIGLFNDGATGYNHNTARAYEYSGNTYGLKLTIEYSTVSSVVLRRRR